MTEERSRINRYNTYQDGSAARDLSVMPLPEERTRTVRRRIVRKGVQKEESKKNIKMLILVLGVSAVLFILCAQYLGARGIYSGKALEVENLQKELKEITMGNDEREDDINTNIDYKQIYDTVTNDYGMGYPGDGQIRTYDAGGEGYARQYKDIPG